MSAVKGRDTRPELALRRELHRRGLRFRVHHKPLPDMRRTADVVFTRARVAVFLDGCWFHGCPEHYREPPTNRDFWLAKVKGNVARDRDTDRRLREAGWSVLRAWEHEDPARVADQVEDLVRHV